MVEQIDKQYWKHHTAQALVQRELRVIDDITYRTGRPYIDCLKERALQLYQEAKVAVAEYNVVKDQVLIEALGTLVSGGLELTLTADEHQEISDDKLIPFVTPTTRRRYIKKRGEASKLCEFYNLLHREYINL